MASPISSPYPRLAKFLLPIQESAPKVIKAINWVALAALTILAQKIDRNAFLAGVGTGIAFGSVWLAWEKILPPAQEKQAFGNHCAAPSAAAGCGPSYSRLYSGRPLPEWAEMTVSNYLFSLHLDEHHGKGYVPFFGFLLGMRLVNEYTAFSKKGENCDHCS